MDASVEKVWKAWSESEYVMKWWGPKGFISPSANIDFRNGGTSHVCMYAPEYGNLYNIWTFESIESLQKIAYISNLADDKGNKVDPVSIGMPPYFPQDQLHVVTFRAVAEDRTELMITEYDWPVGQMMEMSKIGLEQCLDKMAALVCSI